MRLLGMQIPFTARSSGAVEPPAPPPATDAALIEARSPAKDLVVAASLRGKRQSLNTIEPTTATRNVERYLRAYIAGSTNLVGIAAAQIERALTGATGTVGGSMLIAQPPGTDVVGFARNLATAFGGRAIVVDNGAPLAAQLDPSATAAARGTKIPLTVVVAKLSDIENAEMWGKLVRRNVPSDVDLSRCLVVGYLETQKEIVSRQAEHSAATPLESAAVEPPSSKAVKDSAKALVPSDAAHSALVTGSTANQALLHWGTLGFATPETKADIYAAFTVACRRLRDRLEDPGADGTNVASSGTAIRMTKRAQNWLIAAYDIKTTADAMAVVGQFVDEPLIDHLRAGTIGNGEFVAVDVVNGELDFQVLRDTAIAVGKAHTLGLASARLHFTDPNDVITWAESRKSIGAREVLDVLQRMPAMTGHRRQDSSAVYLALFQKHIGGVNPSFMMENDAMAMLVVLARLTPCGEATAKTIKRAALAILERHPNGPTNLGTLTTDHLKQVTL